MTLLIQSGVPKLKEETTMNEEEKLDLVGIGVILCVIIGMWLLW